MFYNLLLEVYLIVYPFFCTFSVVTPRRPNDNEGVTGLDNINDIRNGFFASLMIHRAFDQRLIAILALQKYVNKNHDSDPIVRPTSP